MIFRERQEGMVHPEHDSAATLPVDIIITFL